MRATVKYMLIAWSIVAAICIIIILLIGVAAENEETAGTGFAALIVSGCVFLTISFGMCMESRSKHSPPSPAGDPIYPVPNLPPADRETMASGSDAPLVEALRRSLDEQV